LQVSVSQGLPLPQPTMGVLLQVPLLQASAVQESVSAQLMAVNAQPANESQALVVQASLSSQVMGALMQSPLLPLQLSLVQASLSAQLLAMKVQMPFAHASTVQLSVSAQRGVLIHVPLLHESVVQRSLSLQFTGLQQVGMAV